MALTDLTRISTSGIATGSTIDSPILRKDVSLRGSQVGVTSALFDSSDDALEFNDNVKLKFGNGGDLEVYHTDASGGYSAIRDVGTGSLIIGGSVVEIKNAALSETQAVFNQGGTVELYNASTKRFETSGSGAIVTGILTATSFSGPVVGNTNNASGISTFYDLRVTNNLTVEGSTTTLDTNLIGVDRVEVGANSNSVVGVAITQSGTADIVNLFDGSTKVVTIDDEGNVGLGSAIPSQKLDVNGTVKATTFSGSGASLTNLNGSNIASGTVPVARIGTGTKNTSTFYRGDGTFATPTAPAITSIASDGANRVITSDGDGTATAEANFTYNGTEVNITGTTDGVINLNTTDSRGSFIRYQLNGTTKVWAGCGQGLSLGDVDDFGIRATDNIRLRAGASERMTINGSDGYVNIGTGSAEQQLTVQNSAQHSLIRVISKNNSDAGIDFGDTDDTDRAGIRYTNSTDTLSINANADTRIVIDSSGRVMIGGGGTPSQVGDGRLIVYSTDRLHPAIKCAGQSNNYANGWTLLGDNYQADESQINLGLSYSSSKLVLSRGVKVSGSADDTYLSSQDSFSTRPCAITLDHLGAFNFLTTETNATVATDSAVSLTNVFTIDRVGRIYQRVSGRNMHFGSSGQLEIGVSSGGDPVINAAGGDTQIKDAGNNICIVRSDGFEMYQGIYPTTNDSKDLGKSAQRWKGLYLAEKLDIDTNDATDGHIMADFNGVESGANHAGLKIAHYLCGSDDNRTGLYWEHQNVSNERMWMGDDRRLYLKNSNPTSSTQNGRYIMTVAAGYPDFPSGSSADNAAYSALEIKKHYPNSQSGNYWIYDNNNVPRQIYCDMEIDGGGWMLWHDHNYGQTSMNEALGGSGGSPSSNLARSNWGNYAYYNVLIRATQIDGTGERLHSIVQLDGNGAIKRVADYGGDFFLENVGDLYQPNLNHYFNDASTGEYVGNTQMYQPQCGATEWEDFSNGGNSAVFIRELDSRITPGMHRSCHLVERIYGFDDNGVPNWTVAESMHPKPFFGDVILGTGGSGGAEVADGTMGFMFENNRQIDADNGNNGGYAQGRMSGVLTGQFEVEFKLGNSWGWSQATAISTIQVAENLRDGSNPYNQNTGAYAYYGIRNNSSNNKWNPFYLNPYSGGSQSTEYSGGINFSVGHVLWRTSDGTIYARVKDGTHSTVNMGKWAGPFIVTSGTQSVMRTEWSNVWNADKSDDLHGRLRWYK